MQTKPYLSFIPLLSMYVLTQSVITEAFLFSIFIGIITLIMVGNNYGSNMYHVFTQRQKP